MSIEKLQSTHALKSGSQVWFIPEKSNSDWAKFLDWHMNFLIAKANKRVKKILPATLKDILVHEEIDLELNLRAQYEQTLFSTQNYLPNASTVMISNFQDIDSWTEQILLGLKHLKPQSVRIFLPKNISADQFTKKSKDAFENLAVTVVEDMSLNHQ